MDPKTQTPPKPIFKKYTQYLPIVAVTFVVLSSAIILAFLQKQRISDLPETGVNPGSCYCEVSAPQSGPKFCGVATNDYNKIIGNNCNTAAGYRPQCGTPSDCDCTCVPSTPISTNTPVPTNTSVPTSVPVNTNTPVPTTVPVSTNTPVPTSTVTLTSTPIATLPPTTAPTTASLIMTCSEGFTDTFNSFDDTRWHKSINTSNLSDVNIDTIASGTLQISIKKNNVNFITIPSVQLKKWITGDFNVEMDFNDWLFQLNQVDMSSVAFQIVDNTGYVRKIRLEPTTLPNSSSIDINNYRLTTSSDPEFNVLIPRASVIKFKAVKLGTEISYYYSLNNGSNYNFIDKDTDVTGANLKPMVMMSSPMINAFSFDNFKLDCNKTLPPVVTPTVVHTLTVTDTPVVTSIITPTVPTALNHRILEVGTGTNVTLSGMKLINGRADDTATNDGINGGAVLNRGDLTVLNSILSNNSANTGGAIQNLGTLSTNNSKFIDNLALEGTAINNSSIAYIDNSEFSGNKRPVTTTTGATTSSSRPVFYYAAISGAENSNTAIHRSSILNNFGAGVKTSGNASVTNSTITKNEVGSILSEGNNASLKIYYSTITANGDFDVYNSSSATATVQNSIVSKCTKLNGLIISNGYNFFQSNLGCDSIASDNIVDDFSTLMSPFDSTSKVYKLLPNSEAIDNIPLENGICQQSNSSDQLGTIRPQGTACDSGAYEYPVEQFVTPTVSITPVVINCTTGLSDDFNSNLDLTKWNKNEVSGGSIITENGQLKISIPAVSVNDFSDISTTSYLEGNFGFTADIVSLDADNCGSAEIAFANYADPVNPNKARLSRYQNANNEEELEAEIAGGQKVRITLPANTETITGRIDRVGSRIDIYYKYGSMDYTLLASAENSYTGIGQFQMYAWSGCNKPAVTSYFDNFNVDCSNILSPTVTPTIPVVVNHRILEVDDDVNVTLSGLTLTGGNADDNRNGGALLNHGTVNILNSILSANTSPDNGGAIANDTNGQLVIDGSTLLNNVSANDGGAIYNMGFVYLSNSNLTFNTATNQSVPNLGEGGAIYNEVGGVASIFYSQINNNSIKGGKGNALNNQGRMIIGEVVLYANGLVDDAQSCGLFSGSTATLEMDQSVYKDSLLEGSSVCIEGQGRIGNSTFANNYNAIYVSGPSANVRIDYSTLVFSADVVTIPTNIKASLIADNGATVTLSANIIDRCLNQSNNPFVSGGYNVSPDSRCLDSQNNTDELADFDLVPFDGNVFRLQSTSPALNNILPANDALCTNGIPDQLGTIRPQGPACDSGAYEQPIENTPTPTIPTNTITCSTGINDDFNDNNLNTTIWSKIGNMDGVVSEVNGKLNISLPAGQNQTPWTGVVTNNFINGDFTVETEVSGVSSNQNNSGAGHLALSNNAAVNPFVLALNSGMDANGRYIDAYELSSGYYKEIRLGASEQITKLRISRIGQEYTMEYSNGGAYIRFDTLNGTVQPLKNMLISISADEFPAVVSTFDNFNLVCPANVTITPTVTSTVTVTPTVTNTVTPTVTNTVIPTLTSTPVVLTNTPVRPTNTPVVPTNTRVVVRYSPTPTTYSYITPTFDGTGTPTVSITVTPTDEFGDVTPTTDGGDITPTPDGEGGGLFGDFDFGKFLNDLMSGKASMLAYLGTALCCLLLLLLLILFLSLFRRKKDEDETMFSSQI